MNNKITIVHLITSLDTGGAEHMLYKLVSGMDKGRFNNIVISMTNIGEFGKKIQNNNIKVITLDMNRGVPGISAFIRLSRILRQEHPDIIQTWLYHADLLGFITGKLTGYSKIIWNVRCSDIDMSKYSFLSSIVRKILVVFSKFPTLVIANSKVGMEEHKKIGYRTKKWVIIPNGIDTIHYKPNIYSKSYIRNLLKLSSDLTLIGLIARYDPMKDHGTFLEVARRLAAKDSSLHFVMIGTDINENNSFLMKTINDYNLLNRISMMGEQHELWKLLPELDIVVLTSAYGEGFPNIIGEAMSSGVPCVSTDVGDVNYLIGDSGFVVPPGNVDLFAEALGKMIQMEVEERKELGNKARQRIMDKYELKNIVKSYEKLYLNIMGS